MNTLRFEAQDIYITQKRVKYCGSVFPNSKKNVVWTIKHGDQTHTVDCLISFNSGKKKVTHNGYIIMNLVDNKDMLDCSVYVGPHRMIFRVNQKSQVVNVQRKYTTNNDQFTNFRNIYSKPIDKIYQKYF